MTLRLTTPTDAFDATRSYDPDGDVTEYLWDFDGDGTVDTWEAKPRWRFTSPGSRHVRLTVRDTFGAEASTELSVEVLNQAPVAVITPPAARTAAVIR